jgi:hypothetical protein
MSAREWSETPLLQAWGISAATLRNRKRAGWSDEEALTQAVQGGDESDEPRFELDDDTILFVDQRPEGATLEEIGEFFGICRERVRQIEAEALAKIRETPGSNALFEYLRARARSRDETEW